MLMKNQPLLFKSSEHILQSRFSSNVGALGAALGSAGEDASDLEQAEETNTSATSPAVRASIRASITAAGLGDGTTSWTSSHAVVASCDCAQLLFVRAGRISPLSQSSLPRPQRRRSRPFPCPPFQPRRV
jgi:hypothetical protein